MNLFVYEVCSFELIILLMCGLHYNDLKPYMRPKGNCRVGTNELTTSRHLLEIEVNACVVDDYVNLMSLF